jgi:hypothetical protein
MARKNHQLKPARPAAQIAAMNLHSVMSHITALRGTPRLKKPAPPRRRIAIVLLGGEPEPVKIRHIRQNLGSVVSETRMAQSPRQ